MAQLVVRGMTLSETPGSLKRFRRTPGRFQKTFRTPLQNLPPFVRAILTAVGPLQAASLTTEQVVFEPKHLMAMLVRHSLPAECRRDWSVAATGQKEVEELLEAA